MRDILYFTIFIVVSAIIATLALLTLSNQLKKCKAGDVEQAEQVIWLEYQYDFLPVLNLNQDA